MIILSELLLLCTIISIVCAYVGIKRSRNKGGLFFSLFMISAAIYTFGYSMQLRVFELSGMILWAKFQYFGIAFLPVFWFFLSISFVGFDNPLFERIKIIVWVIPVITLFLVLTMEYHSLYYISPSIFQQGEFRTFKFDRGIWYLVHQVFANVLIIGGTLVFVTMYLKFPKPFKKQALIAIAGSTFPWLAYIAYLFNFVPYHLDIIPFAITLSGVVFMLAMTSTDFLKIIPIAREKTFEDMLGSVFVFDEHNFLMDFNPSAKKAFSFLDDSLISKHAREVFEECPDLASVVVHMDKTNRTERENFIFGERTFAGALSLITDEKDRITGKLVILNDISSGIEAMNKITKYSEELKSSLADKDKLFSIIAHDLRGPFQGFLGLSGLLAEETESLSMEEIKDLAAELNKALKTQFAFLEELLQWAGLNTNRINLNKIDFDLADAIKAVAEVLKNNAETKNIKLEFDNIKSTIINADKDLIKLVVRNLLSNAIKFTRRGGKIAISLVEDNYYITVEVKDNGVGIKESDLAKLFNSGSRVQGEGTDKERGSGLGLLLCKEIVEKHNGEISVESVMGLGSKFFFTIPKTV